MKRLLVLLITVLVLLSGCVKEQRMAIEFTGAEDQGIGFGAISGIPELQNLYTFSMVCITRVDASADPYNLLGGIYDVAAPYTDETLGFAIESDGRVWFRGPSRVTTDGQWHTDAADIAFDGSIYTIGVSFSGSDTGNDPVFYKNGIALNTNETSTPNGALDTGLNSEMFVGSLATVAAGEKPPEGVSYLYAIFDRILAVEEHKTIHDSRSVVGLDPVFLVYGRGAATQQIYDGQVLAAADKIIEEINGYAGTPNASPKGYADDHLNIR